MTKHLLVTMALLSAASTPARAQAKLPADGVLIASRSGGNLYIHRVKADGVTEAYKEKVVIDAYYGWSDAKTLWVLRDTMAGKQEVLEIAKIVDGKVAENTVLAEADWKDKPGAWNKSVPALYITKKGEVWASGKSGASYLRVDAKPFVQSTKEPKAASPWAVAQPRAAKRPAFKADKKKPKGFDVKLTKVEVDGKKVPGAVCKAGDASVTWPTKIEEGADKMTPKKTTWLRAAPALARIDTSGTNGLGEKVSAPVYMLGCKEVVADVEDFGAPVWGVYRDKDGSVGTWTMFVGDKEAGTLPGEQLSIPRVAAH